MKENKLLKFLYKTFVGRCLLKIITNPIISKLIGKLLDTNLSTILIKNAIKKNDINILEYENKKYKSFNDFFVRRKKKIVIDKNASSFISPCDGNLLVYKIKRNGILEIKNSIYTVSSLIENTNKALEFEDGYCLIFRLCTKDYHRYCYVDNGEKSKNIFIKGILHTVRPIAFENYKVYKTNSREWSLMKTENFGEIVQIEVGALLVGKIINYHQEHKFKKGEEKGRFEYGGSTIIVLVKKDKVILNKEILRNSNHDVETPVKIGQKIGISNEGG